MTVRAPMKAELPVLQAIGVVAGRRFAEVGLHDALTEAAAGLRDRPSQEFAFRCCARIARANGELGGEEADVLGTLQVLFKLTPDDVKRLLAA